MVISYNCKRDAARNMPKQEVCIPGFGWLRLTSSDASCLFPTEGKHNTRIRAEMNMVSWGHT